MHASRRRPAPLRRVLAKVRHALLDVDAKIIGSRKLGQGPWPSLGGRAGLGIVEAVGWSILTVAARSPAVLVIRRERGLPFVVQALPLIPVAILAQLTQDMGAFTVCFLELGELVARQAVVLPDFKDDDLFIVAANSFRASGGGGYTAIPNTDIVWMSQDKLREILIGSLQQRAFISDVTESIWRFTPIMGAEAQFQSAPHAIRHVGQAITHNGAGRNGFETYSLTF